MSLDNGQHILIGAYTATLRLMRLLGVDGRRCAAANAGPRPDRPRRHRPDAASGPAGDCLRKRGAREPGVDLARQAFACCDAATRLGRRGFACDARLTVAAAVRRLSPRVRAQSDRPPVRRGAEYARRRSERQRLPARAEGRVVQRARLRRSAAAAAFAERAVARAGSPLACTSAMRRSGCRSASSNCSRHMTRGLSMAMRFDAVILAADCRRSGAPGRAISTRVVRTGSGAELRADRHRVRAQRRRAPAPSHAGARFRRRRRQAIPHSSFSTWARWAATQGLLAFVISGAGPWVERGADATVDATLAQAQQQLARVLRNPLVPLRTLTEKRATFACTPGLLRPPAAICDGLVAAGDYVDGPYPATLEGAVRSGLGAARLIAARLSAESMPMTVPLRGRLRADAENHPSRIAPAVSRCKIRLPVSLLRLQ